MVIDLFGLTAEQVRRDFPEVYQRLLTTVKPGRDANNRATYLDNWWIFGEPRRELRPALKGLSRFVATVDTARHRTFQFVPSDLVLDAKSVVIASEEPYVLAALSARPHIVWSQRLGGWLRIGNDSVYTKGRTFDPFTFPDPSDSIRGRLRAVGEELDATRKAVQIEHPDLTLTGLYNVLEKLRAGEALSEKDEDVKARGRVLILKDLRCNYRPSSF